MTERDGLQDEMRRLLLGELGADPLAIDQDTADRLLAGRLDPVDAPPGYAEVARVLAAAAAPATPRELDGEETAAAVFAHQRLDRHGVDSHAAPRRSPLGSKFAVAAVAVAVLMVGGIAAATGTLPGPAQRLADSVARTAQHLQPWSSSQHGDGGVTRRSGLDQRPAVGGGHSGGQPHHRQGQDAVRPGSAGRGATGKANQGAHGAPKAKPGGAHGKSRSAASQAATTAPASSRVVGHRKEKAMRSRPVADSPPARSPSPASKLALS